ncbi:MAG TPA: helix-turn-helix domain-containing protein [Candidatus Babeliales bacterium]|nr:helix-turn-helix domain-containing protein [Candidatus Babeliales bacterium]
MPSNKEIALAEKSSRILSNYIKKTKTPVLQLVDNNKKHQEIALPPLALQLLMGILEQMGRGKAVSLVFVRAELTTQEAADFLNVSRVYMLSLLKEGVIPSYKVGNSYKILVKNVIKYKSSIDKKRLKALDALTKQAQALDMGY